MCKNFTIPVGNECHLRVLLLQPDGYVVDLSAADEVHAYIGDKYKMIEVEEAEINGNSLIVPLYAEQKAGRYDFKLTAIIEGRNISACAHEMIIRSTYGDAAPAEIVVVMQEHSAEFYHGYVAGENITIKGDVISATGGGVIPADIVRRLVSLENGKVDKEEGMSLINHTIASLLYYNGGRNRIESTSDIALYSGESIKGNAEAIKALQGAIVKVDDNTARVNTQERSFIESLTFRVMDAQTAIYDVKLQFAGNWVVKSGINPFNVRISNQQSIGSSTWSFDIAFEGYTIYQVFYNQGATQVQVLNTDQNTIAYLVGAIHKLLQ